MSKGSIPSMIGYKTLGESTKIMVAGYWKDEEKKKKLFTTVPLFLHQLSAKYHGDQEHFHPDMISNTVRASKQYAKLELLKKKRRGSSYGMQYIANISDLIYQWKFRITNPREVGFGISTNIDPATFKTKCNPFVPHAQRNENNYVIKIENQMGWMFHEYLNPEQKKWEIIGSPAKLADQYTMTLDGTKLIFRANDVKFFEFDVIRKSKVHRMCTSLGKDSTIEIVDFKIKKKEKKEVHF